MDKEKNSYNINDKVWCLRCGSNYGEYIGSGYVREISKVDNDRIDYFLDMSSERYKEKHLYKTKKDGLLYLKSKTEKEFKETEKLYNEKIKFIDQELINEDK